MITEKNNLVNIRRRSTWQRDKYETREGKQKIDLLTKRRRLRDNLKM